MIFKSGQNLLISCYQLYKVEAGTTIKWGP